MKKLRRFKRKQKGFTLIELLIVVAILGVLAAVVIPNVVGLMGRGGAQAYETDAEVIQLATSTFYSDAHGGLVWVDGTPADTLWSCNDTTNADLKDTGHYYPTALAYVGPHDLVLNTNQEDPDIAGNYRIDVDGGAAATDADIQDHAIWVGLLINEAGMSDSAAGVDGDPDVINRGAASPLIRETGLYLQDMPESASAENGSATPGGYTWVVGNNGTVFGAYSDGTNWYNGFNGGYP